MKPHQLYPNIAGCAYSKPYTFDHSYEMGKYVADNKIGGCIIECGVGMGANLAAMVLGSDRRAFVAYDSFEGIQLAGKHDTVQAGIGAITHDVNVPERELLKSSGITVHSYDQVKDNLIKWLPQIPEKVIDSFMIKGWVQDTITLPFNMPISILRLDMDVYDPTLHCLKMMYDAVSVGGVVIIDDWALDGVRKAVYDYFGENLPTFIPINESDPESPVYWFK